MKYVCQLNRWQISIRFDFMFIVFAAASLSSVNPKLLLLAFTYNSHTHTDTMTIKWQLHFYFVMACFPPSNQTDKSRVSCFCCVCVSFVSSGYCSWCVHRCRNSTPHKRIEHTHFGSRRVACPFSFFFARWLRLLFGMIKDNIILAQTLSITEKLVKYT